MLIAAVCLGGLCLTTIGAWATLRELQSQDLGKSPLERVVSMQDMEQISALAITSQNNALLDCATALNATLSLAMRYLGTEALAKIAPNCLDLADYLTIQTPTNAYAWYVGALASAALSDWIGMNKRMDMSWRTGPSEQWIGELRVALAEKHLTHLDHGLVEAHQADLRMLVLSTRGVRSIAARYVADPSFRQRITNIVETLPTESQERFVLNVRRFAIARAR